MPDQAEKLRLLAHDPPPAACDPVPGPPMIVVAGGKPDVGATTVAVNLAAALADRSQRVVVVDAACEQGGLAQAAGIAPVFSGTVADVRAGRRAAESLVPGPAGSLLLANHWAPHANHNLSRQSHQRLFAELESLHDVADVLVVDVGNGLSSWSRRFWRRARLVVLVTTTDSMAVMNTYAAIKLNFKDGIADNVRVLANQCENDRDASEVNWRLAAAGERFLGCPVQALPALPRHASDCFAGIGPEPRVWKSPNSPFGHAVLWLAHAVDELLDAASREIREVRVG